MPRYINPYTDFGFKRLFGSVANKSLLIDFLNCLVLPEHTIADLEFWSTSVFHSNPSPPRSCLEIRCTTKSGDAFLVAMQKAKYAYFRETALFDGAFRF